MTTTIAVAPGLPEALAHFVTVFAEPDLAQSVATTLNCGEVDALAGLMRASSDDTAADLWIAFHAADDDEGDAHYLPKGDER